MRPRWVAYNFLGLDKINPNGRKWQPQILQYIKSSLKVANYAYIWFCSDFFYKASITHFSLDVELRKKNYYACRSSFDKNLNRLVVGRLKPSLEVILYSKQNGLCAFCGEMISEREILTRSPKVQICYTPARNVLKNINTTSKFYKIFEDKILLHDRCCSAIFNSKFPKNFAVN